MEEKKWKNKNFISALKNALNGIIYIIKNEMNIKIELLITVIVIIAGFVFKISILEWEILILTIGFVIFAEILNSVIEKIVDFITEDYNEKAKIIKDMSAGFVTVNSLVSVIIGILMFLPKILQLYG